MSGSYEALTLAAYGRLCAAGRSVLSALVPRRSVRCSECGGTAIATGCRDNRRASRTVLELHLLACHPERWRNARPLTSAQEAAVAAFRVKASQ